MEMQADQGLVSDLNAGGKMMVKAGGDLTIEGSQLKSG